MAFKFDVLCCSLDVIYLALGLISIVQLLRLQKRDEGISCRCSICNHFAEVLGHFLTTWDIKQYSNLSYSVGAASVQSQCSRLSILLFLVSVQVVNISHFILWLTIKLDCVNCSRHPQLLHNSYELTTSQFLQSVHPFLFALFTRGIRLSEKWQGQKLSSTVSMKFRTYFSSV